LHEVPVKSLEYSKDYVRGANENGGEGDADEHLYHISTATAKFHKTYPLPPILKEMRSAPCIHGKDVGIDHLYSVIWKIELPMEKTDCCWYQDKESAAATCNSDVVHGQMYKR
jgi:hypothetical protein